MIYPKTIYNKLQFQLRILDQTNKKFEEKSYFARQKRQLIPETFVCRWGYTLQCKVPTTGIAG